MSTVKINIFMMSALILVLGSSTSIAGVLDPDCDAGDAVRSATMKATVGVGGRCNPAETAKDMTKGAIGIEDKGLLKRNKKDRGLTKKAAKKVLN